MYKIKELTPEQIRETKVNFPQSNPDRFLLVEEYKATNKEYKLGYYHTREEAEKGLKEWEARDELGEKISDFIDEMIEQLGDKLTEEQIREQIKEA